MVDADRLSEAIVVYCGFGRSPIPDFEVSRVIDHFGEDEALDLLFPLNQAVDQFYESKAFEEVAGLAQMGQAAIDRFRKIRPEISDEALKALAWCYTWDYK